MGIFDLPVEIDEQELLELVNKMSTVIGNYALAEARSSGKENADEEFLSNLVTRVLVYGLKLDKLTKEIENLRSTHEELEKLKIENEQLRSELNTLRQAYENVKSEKDVITTKANELELALINQKREYEEKVSELENQLRTLIDNLRQRDEQIFLKNREIEEKSNIIKDLEVKLEKEKEEKGNLTSKLAQLMTENENLKQTIEESISGKRRKKINGS